LLKPFFIEPKPKTSNPHHYRQKLSLPLFVADILADDPDYTLPLNNATIATQPFY
jgi:hypothetical protein